MQKQAIKTEVNPVQGDEIWRDVVGYEGYYMVSNMGRVKRLPTITEQTSIHGKKFIRHIKGRIMTVSKRHNNDNAWHNQVVLCKNGKRENVYAAILVARAFLGEPKHGENIKRLDGNTLNDKIENLAYASGKITYKDNEK